MKKFVIGGIILFVILLIGFHYYIAYQAENMIDKSLQELSAKAGNTFTINYSSIDISPLLGDIQFQDINYIKSSTISRASQLTFDLDYIDFLRIYFGGAEYGFKHIDQLKTTIDKPSMVFRKSIREAKAKKIHLDYNGNILDLIHNRVNQQLLQYDHQLSVEADSLYFSSDGGGFNIDSVYAHADVPTDHASILDPRQLTMKSIGIHWNPPQQIKETYNFFIRGFEYDTNNIPADSLILASNDAPKPEQELLTLDLYTDLFHARSTTILQMNPQSFSSSSFKDGKIRIMETTEQFKNFLLKTEQLFGIKIPLQTKEIIHFEGPLVHPNFAFTGNS